MHGHLSAMTKYLSLYEQYILIIMIHHPYLLQVSCQSNIIQPGHSKGLGSNLSFHGHKLFYKLQACTAEMALRAGLFVSKYNLVESAEHSDFCLHGCCYDGRVL